MASEASWWGRDPRWMAGHHGCRDRGAGMFHQGLTGHAGLDGPAVRLAHLVIGEEFEHQVRILVTSRHAVQFPQ